MSWVRDVRERDAPMNGPILKAKAKKFAEQLGDNKFTGNEGWLGRFETQNQLSYKFLHGEAAEADQRAKRAGLPIGANVPRDTIHQRFGMPMKLAFIFAPFLIERL